MTLASLFTRSDVHRHRCSSIPRGMIFAEVIVTLGLFLIMMLAVVQLQMASLKAQRQLESNERVVQRAHNLLEQTMALPLTTLRESSETDVIASLLEQLPTDPFLDASSDRWQLELTELTSPLSGLQIVIRHQPDDDHPGRRPPIQLVAWLYDTGKDAAERKNLEEVSES